MRLLIVSASAGAGHTRAAQGLEEAARVLHPDADVRHVDILDFTAKAYKRTYAGGYLKMVDRAPALWGALYRASDRVRQRKVQDRFVRFFDKLEFAGFRAYVRTFAPDVVLATHFLPCQVFAPYRARGRDSFPLGVVLTDFDVHAFWVQPAADRFFVGSDELVAILAGHGIPSERITVSGIPIRRAFAGPHDRTALRRSLALTDTAPVVLVSSGGAGVGSLEETVRGVLQCAPVQVLAVTGRNEALRRQLSKLEAPEGATLRVFGFVEQMADLMAASDLAVAKSGGLTTAECLATGLPMIVRDPIPGQEERNADFLLEIGAGLKAHGPASLLFKVRALLSDRERLQGMRAAALKAARKDAAATIVGTMVELYSGKTRRSIL